MIHIKHYKKLFFNEETGKERCGLIQKETEIFCKNNPINKCWEVTLRL
jgi:hypothetical protein